MNRTPSGSGRSFTRPETAVPFDHPSVNTGAKSNPPTSPASAPAIAITVANLTPCHRGNLRAFADVGFGRWLIVKGFRVVQQPNQAPWCGLPSNQTEEEDPATGQIRKRFWALIELPEHWKKAAEEAVLQAWAEYQETGILPGKVIGGQGR